MSFILDILIPKRELSKTNLTELLVEWGGESFSQQPPRYEYKSKLFFHQYSDMDYYKGIVGKSINVHDYIALSLEGRELFDLEYIINNQKKKVLNNTIIVFLLELINNLETFSIVLLRDEECIDKSYFISSDKELIDIVCNSLNWSMPIGVQITKKI